MTDILQLNQINLGLQVAIVIVFAWGIVWKLRGRTLPHAKAMLLAVILNAASLAFLMIPLFLRGLPVASRGQDILALLFLTHHFLGGIAFVLSLFLVARYARGRFTDKYCRGPWLMRATAITWASALVLGLILYAEGYFPG